MSSKQSKVGVKLCRDCRYSIPEHNSDWNLYCLNPKVNSRDPYALAGNGEIIGTHARSERSRRVIWFNKNACGMRGALWEPKKGDNQDD